MIPTPGDTLPGRHTRLIEVLRRAGYEYARAGARFLVIVRPDVYLIDLDELGYTVRYRPAAVDGRTDDTMVGYAASAARVVGLIADHVAGLTP